MESICPTEILITSCKTKNTIRNQICFPVAQIISDIIHLSDIYGFYSNTKLNSFEAETEKF
jgi:hypothetical protein